MPTAKGDARHAVRPVILFDAECVLCSANARFVLEHDRAGHFRLAAMQGEAGAALCRRYGVDCANPDSILIVEAIVYAGTAMPC